MVFYQISWVCYQDRAKNRPWIIYPFYPSFTFSRYLFIFPFHFCFNNLSFTHSLYLFLCPIWSCFFFLNISLVFSCLYLILLIFFALYLNVLPVLIFLFTHFFHLFLLFIQTIYNFFLTFYFSLFKYLPWYCLKMVVYQHPESIFASTFSETPSSIHTPPSPPVVTAQQIPDLRVDGLLIRKLSWKRSKSYC